jgi:hypothetical protein
VVIVVITATAFAYLVGIVTPGVFGFNSGLAAVPLTTHMGTLVGLPWSDANVGWVSQALGQRAALDLLHGQLPWWNPFEGVGAPLLGEAQSAALFPLTPLMALPNGQVLFHLALELVAGAAMLGCLRELRLARWACVAGAIAFACNGTFAWVTNAPFNPVAFLPVLVWGLERCRRRGLLEDPAGWLLVAAGIELSLYAGFPETAYIDGLFALGWALLRAIQQPGATRAAYVGRVAFGAGVGLAVSAPFLAAFAAATSGAFVAAHGSLFAGFSLPAPAASTLGMPYLLGPLHGFSSPALGPVYWNGIGGYLSALGIALGLVGILAGRDRGLRVFLGVWVAVTVARAVGFVPLSTSSISCRASRAPSSSATRRRAGSSPVWCWPRSALTPSAGGALTRGTGARWCSQGR